MGEQDKAEGEHKVRPYDKVFLVLFWFPHYWGLGGFTGYTLLMNFQQIFTKTISRALKPGLVMAAATNALIMLASDRENQAPWAALNCVAHIIDGDAKEQPAAYSPRESWLGIGVNGTAMCAWGVIYEGALLVTRTRSNLLTALLGATVAYFIDYKVVPPQFTPGIEKRLSHRSVLLAYTGIALGFALSPVWNKKT